MGIVEFDLIVIFAGRWRASIWRKMEGSKRRWLEVGREALEHTALRVKLSYQQISLLLYLFSSF